jgi:hypothetical protein
LWRFAHAYSDSDAEPYRDTDADADADADANTDTYADTGARSSEQSDGDRCITDSNRPGLARQL